jgi:hypothetical protein
MVQAVRLQLRAAAGAGQLPEGVPGAAAECAGPPPFRHEWRGLPGGVPELEVLLTLQLGEHADEDRRQVQLSYLVQQGGGGGGGPPPGGERVEGAGAAQQGGSRELSFTTQAVDYSQRQQELIAELRERAAAEAVAGPSKPAAGPAKRKRVGSSGGEAEHLAAPALETRPHVTRTGRVTRTVVLHE